MRSEAELMAVILSTARDDDRIRAVILNGSRANPAAARDPYQDFDIVYLVTDVDSFRRQPGWIARFGEPMIVQTPDDMGDPPPSGNSSYAYLMQFTDGNRIDLTLYPVDRLAQFGRDSLSVLLLDKDGIVAPFPPPSEADYLPTPPTARAFADCCNEFWWVSTYVAKALRRGEIVYAHWLLEHIVREEALRMLTWLAAIRTGFQINLGKPGQRLNRHLPPELWERLLRTYPDADNARTWQALLTLGALFRHTAQSVGDQCGFAYPQQDDDRVSVYLVALATDDAK